MANSVCEVWGVGMGWAERALWSMLAAEKQLKKSLCRYYQGMSKVPWSKLWRIQSLMSAKHHPDLYKSVKCTKWTRSHKKLRALVRQSHCAVGLCSGHLLSPLLTQHHNPLLWSGRILQKFGGSPSKLLLWGGRNQCSCWKKITRGAVFLSDLHNHVI